MSPECPWCAMERDAAKPVPPAEPNQTPVVVDPNRATYGNEYIYADYEDYD